MEQTFANIFYFRRISRIGGTEQFLYEIAKKYHNKDITVLYDETDFDQLMRLSKLVRCIRRKTGQTYKAKRAFYNFNLEALDQIEADEHIFIAHAIYQEIPLLPPLAENRITRWFGVSEYACRELKRYGESWGIKIEPELCYNPLTLEPSKPVLKIVSACRLDDKVKGGQRTLKLIDELDKYCERNNRHYLWTIFTNHTDFEIESPNVVYMKPRPDVREYIADADWLVQLSNDMESYCYSINEALGYGTRIVRTPLSVAKELKIPKQAELVCKWDMSNAGEVAEKMFKPKRKFAYTPPEDGWKGFLVDEPSNYVYQEQKVLVKPLTSYYDLERGEHVGTFSPPFEVSVERAKYLTGLGFVRVV